MKKRGISPLIATVLLLGFTIVIAALVMRWGSDLFQRTTEESSEQIEETISAGTVDINLKDVRSTNSFNGLSLLIENEVENPVEGFIVQVVGDLGAGSDDIGGLDAYSSKWFDVNYGEHVGDISLVKVLPKVIVNGKETVVDIAVDSMAFSGSEEIDPDEHTVGYWRFDGDAKDYSGNGNDGTLEYDAHLGEEGKIGGGVGLDGDGDHVDCGSDTSLDFGTGSLTIEAWVKGDPSTTRAGIVYKGGSGSTKGYYLRMTGGRLHGIINDGVNKPQLYGSIPINDNEWHHVAYVTDRTTSTLYVDGVLDNSIDVSSVGNIDSTDKLSVGSEGGATYPWNGIMDEVRVSSVTRSFE